MNRALTYVVFGFAILLLILAAGCEEEHHDIIHPCHYCPGQINILLGEDTLRYLPGDSASTPVTVIVISGDGTVMSGQRVDVSLANPTLGFIEFLNTSLVDTTDAQGRVNLLYTSIGVPGTNEIGAYADGVTDYVSIVAMPADHIVCEMHVVTSPIAQDSIEIALCVSDCDHNAIIGMDLSLIVFFSTNGGVLSPLFLPTDSTGCTYCTWNLPQDPGVWCLYWTFDGERDSACVTVGP